MPYGGRGRVQRHHIDSDRLNNQPDNIAFLCVRHHNDAHRASDGRIGGGARPRITALLHNRAVARSVEARALRSGGMSWRDIGARFGVSAESVRRWFRKYPA